MQQSTPTSPCIVQHWQTRDVDEAASGLSQRFAHASRFKYVGRRDAFRLQCSWARLADAKVIRASNTGYEVDGFLDDAVFIAFTTEGSVVRQTSREQIATRPRIGAIVLGAGQPFHYAMSRGAVMFGLQIPLVSLARHASALFDSRVVLDDGAALVDDIDLTAGPGSALVRNVAGAFKEIEALEQVGLGFVAEASLAELLVNLAVVCLLPEAHVRLAQEPKGVGSATIERARQYIAAHADGPIRMAEVAKDLGISLRALQTGFQRHLGRSPTVHLFDCRLQKARERLLTARGGTTVAAIAMECGFVNLGAFAARYRNTFGELPSQTLASRPCPRGR